VARPLSVLVDTFGTGVVTDEKIAEGLLAILDLRPHAIIRTLDLLRPIYKKTAAYGHFGQAPEGGFFTWEKVDKAGALAERCGRSAPSR
jgi:S-adenosylmethionine synthetase